MFCLARVSLLTTSSDAAVFCAVLSRFSAVTTISCNWAGGAAAGAAAVLGEEPVPFATPGGGGDWSPVPVETDGAAVVGGKGVGWPDCADTDVAQDRTANEAAHVKKALDPTTIPLKNLYLLLRKPRGQQPVSSELFLYDLDKTLFVKPTEAAQGLTAHL